MSAKSCRAVVACSLRGGDSRPCPPLSMRSIDRSSAGVRMLPEALLHHLEPQLGQRDRLGEDRVAVERALQREEPRQVAPRRLEAAGLEVGGQLLRRRRRACCGWRTPASAAPAAGRDPSLRSRACSGLQQQLHQLVDHRQHAGVGGIGLLDQRQRLELGVGVDAGRVRLLLGQRRLPRREIGAVLVAARARARRRTTRSPRPSARRRPARSATRSPIGSRAAAIASDSACRLAPLPSSPGAAAVSPSRSRQTAPPGGRDRPRR